MPGVLIAQVREGAAAAVTFDALPGASFPAVVTEVGVAATQSQPPPLWDARSAGRGILYYFWVMQATCPGCGQATDLFSSWVRARNAYPRRKPQIQVLCPYCGDFFQALYTDTESTCPGCAARFDPGAGTTRGSNATCRVCDHTFPVRNAISKTEGPPRFRLYGKLLLTKEGKKEYLRAGEADHDAYRSCSMQLGDELERACIRLPTLELRHGHNTRQAMAYGFRWWQDFFNARQLLALGWLHEAIAALPEEKGRDAFLTLFSGVLEFNNMFASYKGEGTGAVRHMFSHHILKPERTPIEANLWGTTKSSGSFSGLFRTRLLKAIEYLQAPAELKGSKNGQGTIVCSPKFSGRVDRWVSNGHYEPRAIYLSCGDSAATGLAERSVDIVLTDPPFFDNVHYSELADFFYAWQQLEPRGFTNGTRSTRAPGEVQDTNGERFSKKLQAVLEDCHRVLKDDGLLVFTYHHSRSEGWTSLASAILGSGFRIVNAHPLRAEMSVAAPKAKAREPIQLDIAIVCRKAHGATLELPTPEQAIAVARAKLGRLTNAGFVLSRNDQKIVLFGQLLTTLRTAKDLEDVSVIVEAATEDLPSEATSADGPPTPQCSGPRTNRGLSKKEALPAQALLFENL